MSFENILKYLAGIANSVKGLKPSPAIVSQRARRKSLKNDRLEKKVQLRMLRLERRIMRLEKKQAK